MLSVIALPAHIDDSARPQTRAGGKQQSDELREMNNFLFIVQNETSVGDLRAELRRKRKDTER